MKLEEIETFLAIVSEGTITGAAQRLYVGQSTVSTRVRSLEEELGVSLMLRGKGQHAVALTPAGENFVPIAHQWLSLWRDTQALNLRSLRQDVAIGSVDLVNNYTFVPLYQSILTNHPELRLDIRTHHSEEIHSLVNTHAVDVGFVFSRVNLPDIYARPIYRELMYLVCRRDGDYCEGLDPASLPAENEIYLNWGSDFEEWHNSYWPDKQYLVKVNTGSLVEHYLTGGADRWSVVPMSLIQVLRRNPDIAYYALSTPPPPRICYQLTPRFPKPNTEKAVQTFLAALDLFIRQDEAVCAFEPWMLTGKA